MPEESLALGGQALIEGVLIKTNAKISMAARTPKGIVRKTRPYVSWTKKSRFFALPVIRGIVSLVEMLVIGYRALVWSAELQDAQKMKWWEGATSMLFAGVLVIGLFVFAPYYLARIWFLPTSLWFHITEGIIRMVVFILYLATMSLFPDVLQSFMYHGAEHKAVHCHEAKKILTAKNVQQFRPEHPRCGTSFLVIVVVVSILFFSLVRFSSWYYNIAARLVLVPVIVGISFELLKLSARRAKLSKILVQPGLLVQRLTTREPTDDQVEVAIAAVKGVL